MKRHYALCLALILLLTVFPGCSLTKLAGRGNDLAVSTSDSGQDYGGGSQKVISVFNYTELMNALGSNREILVHPGNYDPASSKDKAPYIRSVSNLTLTGVPDSGSKYADFFTAGTQDPVLTIAGSNNITLRNLNLGHRGDGQGEGSILSIKNTNEIKLENCRLAGHAKTGLVVENISNMVCKDSVLEDCSYTPMDLGLSRNITLSNCTLKGNPLVIGDNLSQRQNKGILLDGCTLINKNGICSVWDYYLPVPSDTGFEIRLGTQAWNEGRSLAGIDYHSVRNDRYDILYTNTFDGSEEVYQYGKFVELAKDLKDMSKGEIMLTADALTDAEGYNQGYIMNINFFNEGKEPLNFYGVLQKIRRLKPLESKIVDFGWPVTIACWEGINPRKCTTVAEFSNASFSDYMRSLSYNGFFKNSRFMLTGRDAKAFFGIGRALGLDEVEEKLKKLLVAPGIKITDPEFGQHVTYLFTIQDGWKHYYISALESYTGAGDLKHYNTDMIIRTDATSGDSYIMTKDRNIKINVDAKYDKEAVLAALGNMPLDIKKRVNGNINNDILLFTDESVSADKASFVFLTIESGQDYSPECMFQYYKGEMDLQNNSITDVRELDVVDFGGCFQSE